MRRSLLWAAAAMAASAASPVRAADTTIRMVHVEQNKAISGFWNDVARRYEAAHPGVKIDIQFLEAVSYVNKLPTLLQSPNRPNILYSWGGGEMREQVKAGAIADLTAAMDPAWHDSFVPAAIGAYTVDGKVRGVPTATSEIGFFFNKELFARAGVDAAGIKTWDDLLGAVRKLQAAGITPLIAGGQDKWPLNEYWSELAMRVGGKAAFDAALADKDGGFAAPAFVRAGELFKQLADLKPFEPGFLGVTYPQSAGQFGNGRGAMMLMLNGLLGSMKANSADGVGVPPDKLGWFPFPAVAGGQGDAADTLGGTNGWLVTQNSPKEAADFLRFFSNSDNQREAASRGFYIPVVKNTQDAVQDPILRQLAENIARSPYHQNYYDKELGPSVGAVLNDVSTDLASGRTTPKDAAEAVEQAWQAAN